MSPATPRLLAALALLLLAAGFGTGFAIAGSTGLLVPLAAGHLLLVVLVLFTWRDLRRQHRRLREGLREISAQLDERAAATHRAIDRLEQLGSELPELVRSELDRHHVRLARYQDAGRARLERRIEQREGGPPGAGVRDAGQPER